MSRKPTHSTHFLANVRRYFGLDKQTLARYLGITPGLVSHIEAGRRGLSFGVSEQLAPFARLVPDGPPPAPTLAGLAAEVAAPDPAPLIARLDYCRHHAVRLRRALRPLETGAAHAARWRAALPALRAALPPNPGGEAPEPWDAYLVWYRWRWLEQRPTPLPPTEAARYHLLRLQAEAFETEATALVGLLGSEARGATGTGGAAGGT